MIDITRYPSIVPGLLLFTPFALTWILARKRKRLPLPPGPKGYPIIGNLIEIGNTEKPWEVYMEIGKEYGDMFYMESLGTKVLVLNSLQRATDMLEGRSGIYSDRPVAPMMEEMEFDMYMGFMRYGSTWRRQRRALHQQLNPSAIGNYHHVLSLELVQLIKGLESTPQKIESHVESYLSRVIFRAFYGVKIQGRSDPYMVLSSRVVDGLNIAGKPGAFYVDVLPALKYIPEWFPGTSWKGVARYHRENSYRARQEPYNNVIEKMQEGVVEPCVASRMIDALPEPSDPERREEEIAARDSLAAGYIAGSDTTRSLCLSFILLMALCPEVQKKAQAEIDEVLSIGQLPTIEDRPKLVYVQAVIREVSRWLPPAPLSLHHATTHDDIYEGYFIPKGTIVTPNIWAMMRDPKHFADPSRFIPERHIKGGRIDKTLPDTTEIVFGHGRRICPGRYLALDVFYTFVTSTLALFDISAPKNDAGGSKMKYSIDNSGVVIGPHPFDCDIHARSKGHQEVIRLLEA